MPTQTPTTEITVPGPDTLVSASGCGATTPDALGCCHDETDNRPGGSVRIEDVIGYWITREREASRQSQADIGERLGDYLDKPWPRQAVSAAEKGRRAFTAAELVAFSLVLGRPVEALLVPPADVEAIELGGTPVPVDKLRSFALDTRTDLEALIREVVDLRRILAALTRGTRHAEARADSAAIALWKVARPEGVDVTDALLGDIAGAPTDEDRR